MKDLFKVLFTILIFSSAFLVGLYLGEEKVKGKVPNFQKDVEGKT
jgi:hypothetical protein